MRESVRPAHIDDAAVMVLLEAKASAFPWKESHYLESLNNRNHHSYLLQENGCIHGLLVFSRIVDEVELLNVAVDPAYQGQGKGGRLVDFLINENRNLARHIFLEVRETNTPAIALYSKRGFAICGRRKHYYPTTVGREDALIMNYDYE